MPPHRNSNGFTLIELLVVIAIIANLAAILFPVFAAASEKARQASCVSNERQISLAILEYIEDNDQHYPVGNTKSNDAGWAGACQTYIKSTGVFQCPDDSTSSMNADFVPDSYAMNTNLVGNGQSRALASVGAPPNTVMLCEITGDHVLLSDKTEGTHDWQRPPTDPAKNVRTALSAVANGLSYADQNDNSKGGWSPDGIYALYVRNKRQVLTTAGRSHGSAAAQTGPQYDTGDIGGRYNLIDNPNALASYTDFHGAAGRHDGGTNYALADGHVKWELPQKISSGEDANTADCAQGVSDSYASGPDCGKKVSKYQAAGTFDDNFAATFSTI